MKEAVSVTGLEWVRGTQEPLAGSATIEVRQWEDVALLSRERFASDLQVMGLPRTLVAEGLSVRDRAASDVEAAIRSFWDNHPYRYEVTPPEVEEQVNLVYNSARFDAWQRLRDWWHGHETIVESRTPVELHLPLFVLSAPAEPGCSTAFTSEVEQERERGWSVSVMGNGLGGEGIRQVTVSSTLEADSGQCKLIYVPVTVTLETITITEDGVAPVRCHRIDIAGTETQQWTPVSLSLAADAVPPLGPFETTYPLAGDRTGTIATYKYEYKQTSAAKLKVSIKTQAVELGVTSEAKLQSSISLTFKLKSGIDYHLHRAGAGDGLMWA
ncbi:hypothetical protein [Nitrolancea hollandica]|uniref:Uncharacterized protein n=1 Tax=Nitrolancea hollandica Lb TaxID=1129897 RepID=I4EKH7_9BACT|nr:hypothetical protein [Nitrolancea hollandica]CCF85189.1 hypothetical protein NITHO_460025 [Nitrolancea hollandica Lb]